MTASLSYRFGASNECLLTAIGSREDGVIRIAPGRAGTALYGPYVPLPAGRYVASVRFGPNGARSGAATLDVCNSPLVLSQRRLRAEEIGEDGLAQIEFTCPESLPVVEVRLLSEGAFAAEIEAVEIFGQPGAVHERVELKDLPAPSVENISRNGRNIFEGYQRSIGLGTSRHLSNRIQRDPDYRAARDLAGDRTIVLEEKLENIFLILKFFLPKLATAGHLTEWGCYRGGSAIFMAALAKKFLPQSQVIGFDTFGGMPETDSRVDHHKAGSFTEGVNLDQLRRFAGDIGLDNLEFVQGQFEDVAEGALQRIGPISLAHLDCDIRSAIECAYDATRRHMVSGGYWVFDDPLAADCLGAAEAMEDLLVRRDGLNSEQAFPHFVFRQP